VEIARVVDDFAAGQVPGPGPNNLVIVRHSARFAMRSMIYNLMR
jgi:hypothetical protein